MPPEIANPALPTLFFRTTALGSRKPTRFSFTPDAAARKAIASVLDLIELPKLQMKGEILPQGRNDLVLKAMFSAVVVQPCSVTLAPVTSAIAEAVERRYLKDFTEPQADELELHDELDAEPLPEVIDVVAVAIEALMLALPLFPRADGAALGEVVVTAPGLQPLSDAQLKPFAGLAGLAERMKTPKNDPE